MNPGQGAGFDFPALLSQDEGVAVARRPTINFIGPDVTATDDPVNGRVNVTIAGAAGVSGWTDDGTVVRLTTATDQVGIGTAAPVANHKVEVLETGGASGLRARGLVLSVGLDVLVTGEAQSRFQVTHGGVISLGSGTGAPDWTLAWAAANRADIGAGDRLAASGGGSFDVRGVAGDANPTARLQTSGLALGVDSVDALSVLLQVTLANTLELATGDSFRTINGTVSATVDDAVNAGSTTVATLVHSTTGAPAIGIATGLLFRTEFQAGSIQDAAMITGAARAVGAGAEEGELSIYGRVGGAVLAERWRFRGNGNLIMVGNYDLIPQTDSQGDIGTSSNRWATNVANSHRVFAVSGDANPTVDLTSNSIRLGLNSADALSVLFSATATNELGLGVGDQLNTPGGRRIGLREVAGAGPHALAITDDLLHVTSAVASAVTLPAIAAANRRQRYTVKNANSSLGNIAVGVTGGDTIDAGAVVLIPGASVTFVAPATGTVWITV